jgi:hypothetical protein
MQTWFLCDQYTGSAAALTWGSYIYLGSRKTEVTWRDCAWLGWDVSRWFIVAGAGGDLVRLLQRRDEVLLLDGEADKGKKTSIATVFRIIQKALNLVEKVSSSPVLFLHLQSKLLSSDPVLTAKQWQILISRRVHNRPAAA